MAFKEFFLIVVIATVVNHSTALSCVKCDDKPCEIPACCESGQYVHDVCGCCPVCARAVGKRCGGPWGISGTCSKDLACLRSCECATLPTAADDKKHTCVFPFTYKDVTYKGCTTNHSENGDRWCAYEVDENGVAVDGKWADCNDACPNDGEDEGSVSCDESSLFNLDGTCVEQAIEAKLAEDKPAFAFRIESGATETEVAPVCKSEAEATRCRCATSISGEPVGQKSGCTQKTEGEETTYGWCFLENIEDPTDPTKNCYTDALWSHTHGRFWSHRACVPEEVKEPEPIGKATEETSDAPADAPAETPAESS
jgi:hypothetical protein